MLRTTDLQLQWPRSAGPKKGSQGAPLAQELKIGAFIIRIGFWGIVYYFTISIKRNPKIVVVFS